MKKLETDKMFCDQTIYCYFEEQKDALNTFVAEHDNNSIIHIFLPIIESCEGNLFYCLGDIINNYVEETSKKVWFATDVKSLFDIVKKLYSSIFEKVIYIEQNNNKEFSDEIDINEFLNYFLEIPKSKLNVLFMRNLLKLKNSVNVDDYTKFFYEMDNIEINERDNIAKVWCCFCDILLYEMDYKNPKKEDFYFRIALYSIIMHLSKDANYTNAYINTVMSYDKISDENLYFVWNQFKRMSFKGMVSFDEKTSMLLDKIYDQCYSGFTVSSEENFVKIPLKERDKDLVMIFTIQFLDITHAPTRTVIERVKTLCKLGKKVVIVNTSEQYTFKGYIPMYRAGRGRVLKEYNSVETLMMGSIEARFLQLDGEYSTQHKMEILTSLIKELKPYYILSIGSGSVVADLCGNIVPCASMALVFSTLPKTKNSMKILGRKLRPEEEKALSNTDSDIIESKFTFELKNQKMKFTRQEFNLPNDKFILVVVGIRLQYEVSDAFMKMIERVCQNNCHVVFAGVMENYNDLKEKYNDMYKNSSFIGYCDDILALMEICDLYVNPDRVGGGFSVIEAFAKGRPGVYLKKGDVYTAGGEDFAVNDFNEMEKQIIKYKDDKEYYNKMSKLAIERAKVMTSSVEAMADIDRQICQRIEEKYW